MQKLTINLPLFSITIDGEKEIDLFPAAAFWLSIPSKCPLCGKPIILDYTTPQTFKYYKLKCTGSPTHAVSLGEKKGTHELYYDARKSWEAFRPGSGSDHADESPANNAGSGAPISGGDPLAASRNELIKLINEAKRLGIRTGIVPGDVGKLEAMQITNAMVDVRRLIARGENQ